MLNTLTSYWRKWRASRHAGHQLDELLAHADPTAPLAVRNQWLIELAHWVQKRGSLANETRAEGEAARYRPHTRLRYLLQMLDRNPAWRLPVARTLRSVINDSDAISLLCDTGMPVRPGFWGALAERIEKALIPPPPTRRDLSALCSLMFPDGDAADWIGDMPPALLADLIALLHFGEADDEDTDWNPFAEDLLAAMHHLVDQIASTGLSQAVRTRLTYPRVTESPFYRLGRAMQGLEDAGRELVPGAPPSQRFVQELNVFRALLDDCGRAVRQVYAHLDENGVSVDIVFLVERAKSRIRRLERLLEAWLVDSDHATARVRLLADLVRANRASQSVGELARTSFGLLARKVVERSAETGEHYIARTRPEYLSMLKMACGGGLVTVVTVYVKFLITSAHLPTIVEGFLAGANYAICFLFMHFCHFTLATKQPAMTAPAIASKLDDVDTAAGMDAFVGEVIALVRTQAAAIFGNLAMVFPFCLLVQWGIGGAGHEHDSAGKSTRHAEFVLDPRCDAALCGDDGRIAVVFQSDLGLGGQLVRAAWHRRCAGLQPPSALCFRPQWGGASRGLVPAPHCAGARQPHAWFHARSGACRTDRVRVAVRSASRHVVDGSDCHVHRCAGLAGAA